MSNLNENKKNRKEYKAEVKWDNLSGGAAYIKEFPPIRLDTPIEFGGKGRHPCPDELFLAAVGGCLLTTFLYFQRTRNLRPNTIEISINGTVDYFGSGGYRLSGIESTIHIKAKEHERESIEKYAELTKEFCHISRVLEEAIPVNIKIKIQ